MIGGLATTAVIVLFHVYVTQSTEGSGSLLGFYLFFVVPVSAIFAGAAAGAGYSLVSYWRGIRVPKKLFGLVAAAMVIAYFVMQYAEYRAILPRYPDGGPVGFLTYFDLATRSIVLQGSSGNESGTLGFLGYGIRLLELGGFTLGGVIPLAFLQGKPFCDSCSRYFRHKAVAFLPTVAPKRQISASDPPIMQAYTPEDADPSAIAQAYIDQLLSLLEEGQYDQATALICDMPASVPDIRKLKCTQTLELAVKYCPGCGTGKLEVSQLTKAGDDIKRTHKYNHDLPVGGAEALAYAR